MKDEEFETLTNRDKMLYPIGEHSLIKSCGNLPYTDNVIMYSMCLHFICFSQYVIIICLLYKL